MSAMARLGSPMRVLLGLWMAGVMIAMFVIIPPYVGLGDAGRIIIVHVPTAWITTVAFGLSAFYSARYLRSRKAVHDHRAVAAAEVGTLFCIFATVTGAIFAQVVWGVFWNWDPRETTIVILLLIYGAYFALRSAIDDTERQRRLSAVYNLFAAITMPFLLFVAPRVAESSLHPNCAFLQGSTCDGVELALNGAKIGLLGDNRLELLALEQQGPLAVATVQVFGPGNIDLGLLRPSFELATGKPADRPRFNGEEFTLAVERANLEDKTVLLNIEAPGTGLLSNRLTFYSFMAANLGFLGLALWLFHLRAELLRLGERALERRGLYELPA